MVTLKMALKAEAALATILSEETDLWSDDMRKLSAALDVVRKLVQAASN